MFPSLRHRSLRLAVAMVALSLPVAVAVQARAAGAAPQASRWKVVPTAQGGTFTGVAGLSNSDVWVVGYFYDQPSGRDKPLAQHWDGSRFSAYDLPTVGRGYHHLNGVATVSASDVWAVGYRTPVYYTTTFFPLIEHWNGSAWSVVPSPFQGQGNLTAIAAVSAVDIWAVGSRTSLNGGSLLLHYDGSTWATVTDGHAADFTSLNGVAAISSTNVVAGGSTPDGQGNVITFAERWNGFSWTAESTPNETEYQVFSAMAADPSGVMWGVGWKSPGLGYFEFSERYDGTAWAIEPTPDLGPPNNNLYGVVMASPTKVWAVGYESSHGPSPVIQRWDGAKWIIEPDPIQTCCIFYAIGRAGNSLWTVGDNAVLRRGI